MKKTCTKCGVEKFLDEFYPSSKYHCKACLRIYADQRKERDPDWLARWQRQNPLAHKAWYQKNKEHKSAYHKGYRARNKKRLADSMSAWAKANSHKVNANIAKRNAAKLRAIPPWVNYEAIVGVYAEAARLRLETGERYEVDHIVPLQGKIVSGLHWEGNLQILPEAENISKHNRRWPDMPMEPQNADA